MNKPKIKHRQIILDQSCEIEKLIEKVKSELCILKDEKKQKVIDTFERYAMCYVLTKDFRCKPRAISIQLANNNHTMIPYMIRQANNWMDVEKDFKELVDKIRKTLKQEKNEKRKNSITIII